MVHVFIRHKVKDYGTWRQVFDEFAAKRREGGEVAFKIAGISGEPNNLCLFFEWQSVAKAKAFLGSAELAREMGPGWRDREARDLHRGRACQRQALVSSMPDSRKKFLHHLVSSAVEPVPRNHDRRLRPCDD